MSAEEKIKKIEEAIRDYSTPTEDGKRWLRESDCLECFKEILRIIDWEIKKRG